MPKAVRSWLIRGLILAGVAGLGAAAWVASSWVSPERVRQKLVEHLADQFEGVDVHVGSARMRILGGIAVTDVRLTRRGDPPDRPFLVVPAAVIYHDKEQLNRGRLVIRKVELENPEVHLVRAADGTWNVSDVVKPGPADKPVPTIVAKGATVTVADETANGLPPLRLSDARVTLLNDPLPVLAVQAQATADGLGPVHLRAKLNRVNQHLSVGLEVPSVPLAEAAKLAGKAAPGAAKALARLSATAAVSADLTYAPEANPPWRHDVRIDIKDGRFEHPSLPWPAENVAVKLRAVDGRVKVEGVTAKVGPAQLRATMETRTDGRGPEASGGGDDTFAAVEDHLQKLDVSVTGVPLDDTLFARLGDDGAKVKRMFAPTGTVDLGYKFTREPGGWRREVELRPQAVSAVYEKFRYPVADLRGWVKRTTTHAGKTDTQVDLHGTAGGPVTVTGQVAGDGPDPGFQVRVSAMNVPLDDRLAAAVPPPYSDKVRRFRPGGRGDFVVEARQQPGVNLVDVEVRVDVRDGTMAVEQFPYPLEKVRGRIVVRTAGTVDPTRPVRPGEPLVPLPDRDELTFDGLSATHGTASVWLTGSKRPIPGSPDRKLELQVRATNCPIDGDLRKALAAIQLGDVWDRFNPRGSVSFTADVEVIDRSAPPGAAEPRFDPARDVKLTFSFFGPTVTPSFFPYELTDLRGWLEYKNGRLDLAHLDGRHGATRVKVNAGELRFYPGGVVWANLGGIEAKPFVADADMLRALPGKLGPGLQELKLRGGAELTVKHLVVLTPPESPATLPPPDPGPITAGYPSRPGPVVALGPYPAPRGAGSPARTYVARAQAPTPPVPRPFPVPGSAGAADPDPVVYWDAELRLFGASLDTGVDWEDLHGAVACRGRYEGTHMGSVRGNVWLDRGTVMKQPVTGATGHARALPQEPDPYRPGQFLPPALSFTDASATLFGGTVGGEVRVVLADPVRYELWLTATDVQLDDVARRYLKGSDADLKGAAQAQLWLSNLPDPRTGQLVTQGSGRVDVPSGRMYNLPVLLDLVKLFHGHTPDKTAFEEAHVQFRIHGDRVKVDQVDLIGSAVCLGGSGELDADGKYVRFEFYTIWSKVLKQMIDTPIGNLSAFLSKNLFKIKLTRKNGELKYEPEPLPVLTEPAKAAAERLRMRFGRSR